jgi:hypothetical protein
MNAAPSSTFMAVLPPNARTRILVPRSPIVAAGVWIR